MRLLLQQATRIRDLLEANRRLRVVLAERTVENTRLLEENEALRARVAVLADLADPGARSMAASVLRTIEEL